MSEARACPDPTGEWAKTHGVCLQRPCDCANLIVMHGPPPWAWVDKQGDVWRLGSDGLMHTHETKPFPREHVEKKWGPLRLAEEL